MRNLLPRIDKEIIYLGLFILIGYLYFFHNGGFIGDFGDPIGQTIPNKILLTEYYKNGIAPLWNPFSLLGMPFLADIQVGAFYIPDIILFSFLDPFTAHNASVLLHIIFSGIGSYLLLHKLTENKKAALIGACIIALTGSFLTKLVFLNFLETIAYIPWLCYLCYHKKFKILKIYGVTLLMLTAGHPVAAFYAFLVFGIFILWMHRTKLYELFNIGFAASAAILSASPQLIPFWEFKKLTVRDQIPLEEFIGGRTSLIELANFIIPTKEWMNYPVDKYIHFGTVAAITLFISLFFYKKFSKKIRNSFNLGLILCATGLFLATLGFHDAIAKILYHVPILNLTRVSARFIVVFHFGAIICLASFLAHLLKIHKKAAQILGAAIIINSLIIPTLFLERHTIAQALDHYDPSIKNTIEELTEDKFTFNRPPVYFLASSNIIFPNRHVPNFMHNIIGYNPLTSKRFQEIFPLDPVGAFPNPNYLVDYFQDFVNVGLKYYLFPTEEELKKADLEEKIYIIDFLKSENFTELATINDSITIWENPKPTPFAYFTNPENKLLSIAYRINEITIEAEMQSSDRLVLNQSYFPGWKIIDNKENPDGILAEPYLDLVQSYEINNPTQTIKISYDPAVFATATYLSLAGLSMIIVQQAFLFHLTSKKK